LHKKERKREVRKIELLGKDLSKWGERLVVFSFCEIKRDV
jgi:hypothetical protein